MTILFKHQGKGLSIHGKFRWLPRNLDACLRLVKRWFTGVNWPRFSGFKIDGMPRLLVRCRRRSLFAGNLGVSRCMRSADRIRFCYNCQQKTTVLVEKELANQPSHAERKTLLACIWQQPTEFPSICCYPRALSCLEAGSLV